MRCSEFRKVMQRIGDEDLPVWLRDAWENHLGSCSECLDHYAASIEPHDAGEALTNSILLNTSLDPCVPFQEAMCSDLDGELDQPGQESLQRHLGECPACRELAEHMPLVANGLQGLEEAAPPANLVEVVLSQTSVKREQESRLFSPVQKLLRRPRFSLEFSFIATVLWFSVFGLPSNLGTGVIAQESIARSAQVAEVFQVAERNLQGGWNSVLPIVNSTVEGIQVFGSRTTGFVRDSGSQLIQELDTLVNIEL